MFRQFCFAFVVSVLVVSSATAQTTGDNTNATGTTSLAENPPALNASGGAVRLRSPGLTVQAARARHNALRDARLAAQRTQDTTELAPEGLASSTGSAGGSTSGLSGLLNNVLNSGLLGSIGGNLGSSINGLLGGSGATTGGTSTTGTSGGTRTGANSDLPPEVLEAIANAGITLKGLQTAQDLTQPAEPVNKTFARMQQVTDTAEPKFLVRWADSMLSTFFTAVSVGFQTPEFVNVLQDFWRGILIPDSNTASGADATDGT